LRNALKLAAYVYQQRKFMAQRFNDIYEIRRANARTIATRVGVDELRRRLGCSRQRLHALIGVKAVKNIGSDLARTIERIAHYPHNWLDNQHSEDISDFEQLISYAETLPPDRFARLVQMIHLALQGRLEMPAAKLSNEQAESNHGNNPAPTPTIDSQQSAATGGAPRARKSAG
jgi:hypothetical protein